MLKVDHTPDSKLAKRIDKRIKKEMPKTKIMITELAGKTTKSMATNSKDPWVETNCRREKCYQCQTTSEEKGLRGKCWLSNATYRIECRLCIEKGEEGIYVGETKDVFQRCKQHADGLKKNHNVLWNHIKEHHEENKDKVTFKDFEFKPGRKASGPLQRQASEGAELLELVKKKELRSKSGQGNLNIINSKAEFNQPAGLLLTKTMKFWG